MYATNNDIIPDSKTGLSCQNFCKRQRIEGHFKAFTYESGRQIVIIGQ